MQNIPRLKHDMAGQQFGRLTVLAYIRRGCWLCQCRCGTEKVIASQSLLSGKTTSCGCYNIELISQRRKTHGLTESDEYKVWCGVKRRCLNTHEETYKRYGARGITICERWMHSFENFLADMGQRPSNHHTIERINNQQGYSPDNCRWATRQEQAQNTKNTRLITFRGMTKSASEWARILHMNQAILSYRLNHGWESERALTTPVKPATPPSKKYQSLTFEGQTKNLTEWAHLVSIDRQTLMSRLEHGWSIEKALTTPTVLGRNQYSQD